MELKWEEPKQIADGNHTGTIIKILYRADPYQYTDIVIREDDTGFDIKYGCPTKLLEKSKLGRLLIKFGADVAIGEQCDPEKMLLDKRVSFMTIKKGNFSEIVEDSITSLATPSNATEVKQ